MPRKNINHSNTIIFKLVCNDLNIKKFYINSTTEFTKRKYEYKKHITNENLNTDKMNINKVEMYEFIRSNGGWNNWSMIEIEKFPCVDLNEANSRERYWYEIINKLLKEKGNDVVYKSIEFKF